MGPGGARTPGQPHRLAYEVGRFRRHLAAAGHSDAAINIGLPELRGKDPAVITVGVPAQVIIAMAGRVHVPTLSPAGTL